MLPLNTFVNFIFFLFISIFRRVWQKILYSLGVRKSLKRCIGGGDEADDRGIEWTLCHFGRSISWDELGVVIGKYKGNEYQAN